MTKDPNTHEGFLPELKLTIKGGYKKVPFKYWTEWGINAGKYNGRTAKIRFTDDVQQTIEDLGNYFAAKRELLPSDKLRKTAVLVCEDQSLCPRYYVEVTAKEAGKSLSGVIEEIGELGVGDILVIVSYYQPIKPDGSYDRKYLDIIVAGYGILGAP